MKKYKDLYVKEKQRHEEAQQKCQENHMDEMEIISLHKKNATRQKQPQRQVQRHPTKAPRSGYHLFLREQLDEMTEEDRKTYRSIVSRRWREIKEDPAQLSVYNDRIRQMKNEVEKPTKLGHDS